MRTLETVSGKLVNVANPDPSTISIGDIAWGLSRISRFCGQTITVIPYSVAQHSLFVAEEVARMTEDLSEFKNSNIVLHALLHDAAEAFLGDVPSPVKHLPELKPIIDTIENNLLVAIYISLEIYPPSENELKIIKTADRIAQKIEAHAFMMSRGSHWEGLPEVSLERLQQFQPPLDSLTSYKKFMSKFNELKGLPCILYLDKK
jgi:5'-deoxynucleotidase YfbR-like HD superfamily hydrolase